MGEGPRCERVAACLAHQQEHIFRNIGEGGGLVNPFAPNCSQRAIEIFSSSTRGDLKNHDRYLACDV